MAGDEAENIGGISVGIGASHARLSGDLAAAERVFESWLAEMSGKAIQIRAQMVAPAAAQAHTAQPAAPAAAPVRQVPVRQQPITLIRGGHGGIGTSSDYDKFYSAIEKQSGVAQGALGDTKDAIVDVQQAAAQPVAANISFGAVQKEANALLATLLEIVATTKQMAVAPPKAAAGGSSRPPRRPRAASAATGDDEEDDGTAKMPTRIQIVDQLERQRRASRESAGPGMLEVNKSEQALNLQRQREEAATERDRQRTERQAERARQQGSRQTRAASLLELQDQIAVDRQGQGPDVGQTFAPPLTQQARGEQERARQEQEARASAQRAAGRAAPTADPGAATRTRARVAAARVEERQVRSAIRAEQRRDDEVFAQTAPDLAVRREREVEERVARARANVTASGRTGRTASSGIGALFGGTQGRLIEANAKLAASDKAVNEAEKAALPFRKRIAEYDIDIANSSGRVAAARTRAKDAFAADPKTVAALEKERKALVGQREALEDINKLQSGGNVLRNLAAITAGGAAFGIGLKVASVVVDELGKGFNEFFEIQTGFGATSTRVTSALGAQTIALHGNADAALAAAEAQAGISAASAEALNGQLKLTTQIKAGAQAQQQASELFRAGFGTGNAPSGLFGSYGGVLGTGLFGQKGFSQQVQTDMSAFQQGRGGNDLLGNFSRGLDYATNPDARQATDRLAIQQGQKTPLQGLTDFLQLIPGGAALKGFADEEARQASQPKPFQQTQLTQEGDAYLNNLNAAAQRGAAALGDTAVASYRVARSQTEVDQATKAAAAAGDQFGVTLAQQQGIVLAFGDAVAGATDDVNKSYQRGVEQADVGAGIADPATLGRLAAANERQREIESAASLDAIRARQAFEMPSILGALGRQQALTANTQQPAQFALQNLARPLLPVTTGIAAEDQAKVADGIKVAQGYQDQLNARYAEGEQIIKDTYNPAIFKIGGQAAVSAFSTALGAVRNQGIEIAKIQASISNEQADYQVAQYNFQLQIAKRSLSDIGGLIGKNIGAGMSQLGILEGQNLALSRQGQQLQFNMSQRSINFQTAMAGFQAPGVTPEQRQANVKEAQIEAGFAQKQLDIQKQMFGNQVKIVDISNLRQGRDLYKQIFGPGGLVRGRQVTLDIKVKTEALEAANKLQDQNIAKVGTFFAAADGYITTANGQITELEAAAGSAYGRMTVGAQAAMVNIAQTVLNQFGIFFAGINSYLGSAGGSSEPQRVTQGRYEGKPIGRKEETAPAAGRWDDIDPATGMPYAKTASGGMFNVSGPTAIGGNRIAGEAGSETLLILSHPRSAGSSGTQGGTVVNFNGDIYVQDDKDIDEIARKVSRALGREAAGKGLRSL